MTRKLWICLWVLGSATALLAQPQPLTRWTRAILGDSVDAATSVLQTAAGTYLVAGYSSSWGQGGWDAYVTSLDSLGNQQWYRTYGGIYHDAVMVIRPVDDTHFVLAGYTQTQEAGPLNVWVTKINNTGVQQWTRTFYSSTEEYVNDLQPTADGGFIVTGSTESGGTFDVYLRKLNSSGEPVWTRNLNHNDETGYAVLQTLDGGYLVAGTTNYYSQDGYLVKTNSTGIEQWHRFIGGSGDETFRVVKRLVNGDYVIAGKSTSQGGHDRPFLVRTDEDGNTRWTHYYGPTLQSGAFNSLSVLPDGDLVAAGELNNHFYIARIDTTGDVLWDEEYTYISSTVDLGAYAMTPTRDACYVLGGFVSSPETETWDLYVLKTGRDRMTAAEPRAGSLPVAYALSAFPNPFNATTSLDFALPRAAHVRLDLYDVSGRAVKSVADDTYSAGEHRLAVDASALPTGVYFARLATSDWTATRKLLLLK